MLLLVLAFTVLVGIAQTNQSNRPSPQNNAPTADAGISVAPIPDQIFTGAPFTPEPVVKDGAKMLTKNVDYTVNYSNNINVGNATISIVGKGNYRDTKDVTFKIVPKTIAALQIAPIADQTFKGTAVTPDINIKDGSKTLVKDTDYTVSFSNNVNVGNATVVVTGIGNYNNNKTLAFKIEPKSFGGSSRPASTVPPRNATR